MIERPDNNWGKHNTCVVYILLRSANLRSIISWTSENDWEYQSAIIMSIWMLLLNKQQLWTIVYLLNAGFDHQFIIIMIVLQKN